MNNKQLNKNYAMKTVQRAIQVLKAFSKEHNRLSLTEIHEQTKIGKSSLQRLLYTLMSEGLLQRSEKDKRYELGLDFIFFAELVKKKSSILSMAEPIMKELNLKTTESISLNIIEDLQRKCIFNIDSKHELTALTYVGQLSPLYAGASAKVLLAHFSREDLSEYLATISPEKITNHTMINKDELIEELTNIRRNGYAMSDGERIKGAASISAPIFDPFSNVIAGITIMIPSARFDEYDTNILISDIKESAKEITNKMKR